MIESELSDQTVLWVEAALGSQAHVLNARKLFGATSSTLYRLEISQAGTTLPLVLRRFTNAAWLAEEPSVPRHEADALRYARHSGASVPELIAFDESGAAGDVPVLLMSCLPGQVILTPADLDGWLRKMAEALLPIHSLSGDAFPYSYRPYYDLHTLKPPEWSHRKQVWERAIDILSHGAPAFSIVFIHRDYHPVNILWQGEALSGIVDWANACHGALNIDIAHCRSNLNSMYGLETADRFLWYCQNIFGPGFEHHPYWDINALMEWEPGPPEVYPPWLGFGLNHLTPEMMMNRMEVYVTHLVSKA